MIEEFLNIPANREKWIQHVSAAKHPLGQIKELRLSFKHPLVDAHFRFAKDILDILGDLNELFQVRYAFVNNLWECLVSLHQYLVRELWKIENRDLSGFSYLALFSVFGKNWRRKSTTICRDFETPHFEFEREVFQHQFFDG